MYTFTNIRSPYSHTNYSWMLFIIPNYSLQNPAWYLPPITVLNEMTVVQFDVHVTIHHDKFLIIKPSGCTNFSKLIFGMKLHILDSSSVHHQEFFTVHTALVYVIQVC